MGIVRNLVVRFKNWYKDIVNEVINNINAIEVTDDVKLRDNSKGKRPLAELVALVLMATPVLGLTENSEVELTTETGIENQVKDMPLGEVTDEAVVNMLATPTDEMSDEEQFVNREVEEISSVEEYREKTAVKKEELAPILKKWPLSSAKQNAIFTFFGYKHLKKIEGDLQKEGIISSGILDDENVSICTEAMMDIFNTIRKNPSLGEALSGIFICDEDWSDFEEVITSILNNINAFQKNKVTTETAQESYNIIMKLSCNGDRDVIVRLDNGDVVYSLKETPGGLMKDDSPSAALFGSLYISEMEAYLKGKNKIFINAQESCYNMYALSGEFNPESENGIEALTSQHEMLRSLLWYNLTDDMIDLRSEDYEK